MTTANAAAAWVEIFERLRANPISQPVRVPIEYRGRSIPKWGEYLVLRRSELVEFRELCGAVAAQLVTVGDTAEAKLLYSMERCGIDNEGLITFPLVQMADALKVCSAVKVLTALSTTEVGAIIGVKANARKKYIPPGSADVLILSALIAHHEYREGAVENPEPITASRLASGAAVSTGSVSNFWKVRLGGKERGKGSYADYVASCYSGRINYFLSFWNGDTAAADVLQTVDAFRNQRDDD